MNWDEYGNETGALNVPFVFTAIKISERMLGYLSAVP